MTNRSDVIKDMLNTQAYISTERVIYALFLCLTDEELGKLYIDSINVTTIRDLAKKHILKRVEGGNINPFIPFIEQLFSQLETAKGHRRTSIRVMLYDLLDYLPEHFATQFFDAMIDSPRKSDRNRAYATPKLIMSEERKRKLWQKWNEYREEECLLILIQFGEIDDLASVFRKIWETENISYKTKNELLRRMAKYRFDVIKSLKDTNPISYLYGAVIANQNLSNQQATELALRAETLQELGFALWCLGKLQKWDSILEINTQMPQLESKFIEQRRATHSFK